MCLLIGSDGHLTIKVHCMQLWPGLRGEDVEFTQCHDLILRSHGRENLKRLYILSPHAVSHAQESGLTIFDLLDPTETRMCDWAVSDPEPVPDKKDVYTVRFPSLSDEQPLAFEVTRLKPLIEEAAWISSGDSVYASAAFIGTGMTTAVITFQDGREIEAFDPSNDSETTYWLRLAFRPTLEHEVQSPIPFGKLAHSPIFRIQPAKMRSSEVVFDAFVLKLNTLVEKGAAHPLQEGAAKAIEHLEEIFRREGTSVRIENQRMSLMTDGRFWLMNAQVTGPCGFVGVAPVGHDRNQPRIAHTWFAGASHFETWDALTLARLVYLYLREWARNPTDAKTKEQVTAATAPDSHDNVSHVVDVLTELRFVESPQPGYFCVRTPSLADDSSFLKRTTGSEEISLGASDNDIRNRLYGSRPVPGHDRVSRFKPASFTVQYDWIFER